MPLIQSSQDYLPYIDTAPSTAELASARALITASLAPEYQSASHSSLPAAYTSKFSAAIESEHARLASGTNTSPAIDLTRYEALEAPASTAVDEWRIALQKAYASSEYLGSRLTNLGLLETYGKNAWLVGNSQLEDLLKELEVEVQEVKRMAEELETQRRGTQEDRRGELLGLEEAWRKGVGRMIEVEVAAEGLRREILERQRLAAR